MKPVSTPPRTLLLLFTPLPRRNHFHISHCIDAAASPLSSSSSSSSCHSSRPNNSNKNNNSLLLSCTSSDPVESPLADSSSPELELEQQEEGFQLEVKKVGGKNRRQIRAQVGVDAELETVWALLTNYEGLADFIPSLAVSQLLQYTDNFARVYQVGQQYLALGLKFSAKGVIDCYEREMEVLHQHGHEHEHKHEHEMNGRRRRRDIDFKMVEGDFKTFEGTWSIEQVDEGFEEEEEEDDDDTETVVQKQKQKQKQNFRTTLYYKVELEPKLFLPVQLIEGRICREIKNNLLSVREEAHRIRRLHD